MSYLRLISNAVWAGLYGSLLIAELVVFLNLGVAAPRHPGVLSVAPAIAAAYTPAITVILATVFVFFRFFAARRLGIGWVSLKAIVWFAAATLGALTAVYYLNLRMAASLTAPWARDALRAACAAMAGSWLIVLVAAGLAQARAGRRGRPYRLAAAAVLLAVPLEAWLLLPSPRAGAPRAEAGTAAAAEALPPGRAPGAPAPRQGLLLVGFDGASMDQILPLASTRKLPTFERLLRDGAAARLNTIRPCRSRVAWTALATGAPPWASGVAGIHLLRLAGSPAPLSIRPRGIGVSLLVRVGLAREVPVPEGPGRVKPFHEVLRAMGMDVTLVGWPELQPTGPAIVRRDDPRVEARLRALLPEDARTLPPGSELLIRRLRESIARDLSARSLALAALAASAATPRATAVRFPGLASVGAHFIRFHSPDAFGDVTVQEQEAFGAVLSRYYEMADELLAELLEAAGSDTFVLVVSAYGVEPLPEGERLARHLLPAAGARPGEQPSGSWKGGPDGALILHGPGVAAGARQDEADLLDVVPTLLYVMGIPVGRDMPGGIPRRLFDRRYLDAHPVSFITGHGRAP